MWKTGKLCVEIYLPFCAPPRARPWKCERARPPARKHGKGAGPRWDGAARDEKLVPDIYLTIPGSPDAPRPEIYTADGLRIMGRIWSGRTEVDFSLFPLPFLLPHETFTLAKLPLRARLP